MVLRMKNFNIWGFTEKSDFQLGVHKKKKHRGGIAQKGGLEQFFDLGGGLGKKVGDGAFEGVGFPNAHNALCLHILC